MYTLSLDLDLRLFVLILRGKTTADEGRRAFLDIVAHPKFDPTIPIFVDIRAVSEVEANFPEVFAAVQAVKIQMGRFVAGSSLVLLARDGTAYGMARMLQQVVEAVARLRMRVVASKEEACALLGLSAEEMDAAVRLGSANEFQDGVSEPDPGPKKDVAGGMA